jgi:rhamnosyltransferase
MESNVAILLCTYNGEKYLKAQLDSFVKQTYQNYTVYVHDDGSKDDTLNILKEYKNIMGEQLVILEYQNSKHNASYNFCSLLQYAEEHLEEPYIMLSDQDDIWLPDKIEISLKEIVRKEGISKKPTLVYCDQKIVDADLRILYEKNSDLIVRSSIDESFKRIIFRNTVCGCCMCFNRELLCYICRAMDVENIVMHDWWIMLVSKAVGTTSFIPKSLMLYRQHGHNTLGIDNNNYILKIKKYLKNFKPAIYNRNKQTKLCERQALALNSIINESHETNNLSEFSTIMKKNKLLRIYYLAKKNYIACNNYFTLFFV